MSWSIVPLQTLCDDFKKDIVDGPFGSNLKREDYRTEGDPVLKIQNIKEFRIEWKKIDHVTPTKFQELKRHSYRKGDIVMTKLGDPLGVSAIVERDGEGLIVADLVRIRAQKIDTKFLCYCLNAPLIKEFINSQSKGATRPRVRITTVRELPIPVPPLPEQERIVAILDEAFEGIATATAHAERNLHNVRELFQSVLQSSFEQKGEDWVECGKSLNDLCDLIIDCEHKTAPTQETGIPSIRTPNIGQGNLILDNVKRVSEETYETWTRRGKPMPGDLILAREAPAGNVAVIPENTRVCLGQRTVLIRPSADHFLSRFLAYHILEPKTRNRLLAHSTGAIVQHVNLRDIRALNFRLLPSLGQQKTIIQKLDALAAETRRLEAIYQRKLDALAELKQSLLQRAFAGEL